MKPRELNPDNFQQEPPKLYSWSNEPDTMWLREGGCTSGCGACCESMFLPINPNVIPDEDNEKKVAEFDDWVKWMGLHGVTLFYSSNGSLMANLPIKCNELTDDKMCGVFGTDDRPEMCKTYPQSGLELEGIEDVCTFKFRKLEGKIAGYTSSGVA